MSKETDYLWDPSSEPDPEVQRMELALAQFRVDPDSRLQLPTPEVHRRVSPINVLLAIAATLVIITGGTYAYWRVTLPAPWSVETLAGQPVVAGLTARSHRIGTDGRVETDSNSSARLAVGSVGVADIGPGSEVRILRTDAGEHRLALAQGTLHASIWARPRFFILEIPSATVVDLGCVYSITIDSTGTGMLAVSVGEVQLEKDDRRTLVSAGSSVSILRGQFGLPVPASSSAAFIAAARSADDQTPSDSAVATLLREAGVRETITLWHLLQRSDSGNASRIYDRIVELVGAPVGVGKDATLASQPEAIKSWMQRLRPLWNGESASPLRRLLIRMGIVKPMMELAVRGAVRQ